MIVGQEKPDLNDVMHFGVKGMRWGKIKAKANAAKAETAEIKSARKGLKEYDKKHGELEDKFFAKGTTKADDAKLLAGMKKLDEEYKKDPRRAVASRMTRGEKAVTFLLTGPVGLAAANFTTKRSA